MQRRLKISVKKIYLSHLTLPSAKMHGKTLTAECKT